LTEARGEADKVATPLTEDDLVDLFRRLGAPSPEDWARSQVTEGIPQLARFLFLKQAWSNVVPEGNTAWIEDEIRSAKVRPNDPYAGLGAALARCKAAGASPDDLTEIARCVQAGLLFAIAFLLEGPPGDPDIDVDVSWGLFETDERGHPTKHRIGDLHESVLELDPTGREMRPKLPG
jgi:hypothetical protein